MKPKIKAFTVNFASVFVLFLIFRYALLSLFSDHYFMAILGAAIIASMLSPKCGVVVENGEERVKMKWFPFKGVRDIT